MHQYIKYVFIILGSISIAHGCQNTNNNCAKLSLSNKRFYCLCCSQNELFTPAQGGQLKGLFKNYAGFRMHFGREHYEQHKAEIKTQPYTTKKEFIRQNFMGTIKEPTTQEVLEKISSELQKKQNTKNASASAIPTSPLSIPIGSPTLSQHNKTDITDDSETESEEDQKIFKRPHTSKKIISRRKNKKLVATSNSYSCPSIKSNSQFFPEEEFDIQTTEKTKRLKLDSTDVTQSVNTHPSEQCNNLIFFDNELAALAVLKNWPEYPEPANILASIKKSNFTQKNR